MTAPLVSQSAKFDAEGYELVKADLRTLSQSLDTSATVYLSAGSRFVVPIAGKARFYCVSDTATAGSTGAAYHVVTILRNGQSEGIISLDTRNAEIAQYGLNYLGELTVSPGALCVLNVAVTGAPVPTLSSANFGIFCRLNPSLE